MLSVMKDRYSVRSFSDKPVEENKLLFVLEAGRLAPTASNRQPWKVYIARCERDIDRICSLTPYVYKAPVILICCGINAQGNVNEFGVPYAPVDMTIVMTHMVLEAQAQGLGTCIVGGFNEHKVSEEFGLPEGEQPLFLIPLGYPSDECKPSEDHYRRKPEEELFIPLEALKKETEGEKQ